MTNGYGAYAQGGNVVEEWGIVGHMAPQPAQLNFGDPPPAQLYSGDPGNGNPGTPWISVDANGNLYVYGNQVNAGLTLSPTGSAATDYSSVQNALNNAPSGTLIALAPGVWQPSQPWVTASTSGSGLVGTGAWATQGGGGLPGTGTIIRPPASWAQGGAPSLGVIVMGTGARPTVANLWIDGTNIATAGTVGIIANGSTGNAGAIQQVGVTNMLGWGVYYASGADGIYAQTMIIQANGTSPGGLNLDGGGNGGWYSNVPDATLYNVHAQSNCNAGNLGMGISVHNGNTWLVACRADLTAGRNFNISPFNGGSSLGVGCRMVGCNTEGGVNGTQGLVLSGGGTSTNGPLYMTGCQFTGDGQGAGGPWGAVHCSGRVTLFGDYCVSGTAISYALTTAASSGGGVPDLIQVNGGVWQAATGFINDLGPATLLKIGSNVRGIIGAITGTSGTTTFGPVAENSGVAVFSGNGSTTAFTITHGLYATPTSWYAEAASAAANGASFTTASSTTLTVTFAVAPATGTNNVSLAWRARVN